jgi:hypothetical protein
MRQVERFARRNSGCNRSIHAHGHTTLASGTLSLCREPQGIAQIAKSESLLMIRQGPGRSAAATILRIRAVSRRTESFILNGPYMLKRATPCVLMAAISKRRRNRRESHAIRGVERIDPCDVSGETAKEEL